MSISALSSSSMPASYGISATGSAPPKVTSTGRSDRDQDNDATESKATKSAESSSAGRALNVLA